MAQVKTKAEKLAHTEQANAELNTQLSAERRAAKQAGAGAQKQLLGSMRRIQYMVSTFTNVSWYCMVTLVTTRVTTRVMVTWGDPRGVKTLM